MTGLGETKPPTATIGVGDIAGVLVFVFGPDAVRIGTGTEKLHRKSPEPPNCVTVTVTPVGKSFPNSVAIVVGSGGPCISAVCALLSDRLNQPTVVPKCRICCVAGGACFACQRADSVGAIDIATGVSWTSPMKVTR